MQDGKTLYALKESADGPNDTPPPAPVTRFESEGVQTCTFPLLVEEQGREGGQPFTVYVACAAWGKAAEAASVLSAADLVSLQGRLSWRKQSHKCGEAHSSLVVNVREITVLLPGAVLTGNPH